MISEPKGKLIVGFVTSIRPKHRSAVSSELTALCILVSAYY
jgi:hypothetical protein